MNMSFVVVPATLPDIRAIYDVWFAAFKGQLILDLIYPDTDLNDEAFRKVHTEGTLEYWKGLSMEHTFQCIDTDTGIIAGMATWQVYWRERTTEERQKPWIGWLGGDQRERAENFLEQLWEKMEKWIGPKRHTATQLQCILTIRGKGIRAQLMEWGMNVAEQLNLPIYLESTVEGIPLCQKLGFQTLSEGILFKPEITRVNKEVRAPLKVKMHTAVGNMTFEEWAEDKSPSV
ncbi:Acyl-CoA N-acyltransferase [Penicillium expansum]|uniref:Acyl-CoA N-acyltransferase n=1 Tax=Penicillium expansum TaxID=27334 RepID=A0A0A2KQL7_PENEN|nr:Acyl-CoA N-acyltransferase [Penicillium expansum]KGO36744.1 Acyl-CoA N-acyltransferase [Penicillium expansum]KGO60772.1 Acyl-CoA N-acyltransferase [Penicillium expansum]KGO66640.1 Acyl-CoA N-acyltransferase [Penicillium expansum]UPX44778.1 hypothetical protein FAC2J5_30 [Penicillium camemberti]